MATQPPKDPFAAHKFNPLDIPTHLIERFEESPLLAFPPSSMPAETGIYGFYLAGELVYIGKATGQSNLRRRFSEHARKISARKNITLSQLRCRFLIIAEEWVHYAEHHLIGHYKPEWNGSGFGSHVPGAGRPGIKGPATWDQKHPASSGPCTAKS
ncbi:MAG TPA: Eco29kI family restriction endonuclease [Verrucomicrobiae bacterium]|nr:Eco29kI family restriction endonuclease [Verrucomicrobiae bacterium]